MLEMFQRMIDVDTQTLGIIVALSCLAAFMKREILGSMLIAVLIAPVYIFASLVSLYVFRQNYLSLVSDADREATIATAVGITVVFIVFLLLLDMHRAMSSRRVNKNLKDRKMLQGQQRRR